MNIWEQLIPSLLHIPFKWNGRGPDSYDCWGLVRRVYAELGKPDPGDYILKSCNMFASCEIIAEEAKKLVSKSWLKVENPKPGDLVALSANRRIHHLGVNTPYGILHTIEQHGVILETESRIRASGYQKVEYYRWAE